jgi:cell division protein FtsB
MRVAVGVMTGLLLLLQYQLWLGHGSVRDVWRLEKAVAAQLRENEALRQRNDTLEAEVKDLKSGLEAVEERARRELGMIRDDEVFYQVVVQQ